MSGFTNDRILYGILRDSTTEIMNLRCEIHFNRLDTSNLIAELFDIEGSSGLKIHTMMGNNVDFISKSDSEEIFMHGQIVEIKSGSDSDRIGRMRIFKYEEIFRVNNNSINSISFLFHLTPADIFKRRRMKVSHDMKGLLFGYDNWSNADKEIWKEEDIGYETKIGKLRIYPGLIFDEQSDGTNIVKEQLKILIKVTGEYLEYTKIKEDVEETLKTYTHILSVLEGKYINWFFCEVDARGETKKGFIADRYKSVTLYKYQKSDHLTLNSDKYKQILPILVNAYTNLLSETKTELNKAIRQALVASVPKSQLETRLVYWHSCLDILIHIVKPNMDKNERGFSKKLVRACEKMNVNWNDLYPYIKKDEIFSERKADFKITTFRNKMIHHGIYPNIDEYNEVFTETSRAASLFERIFMRILGVEYNNTPIGIYRKFR